MTPPKNAAAQKPELKRFYKTASAAQGEHGWQVLRDGKPIRTPAKALLVLPTQKLAEAIAAEWDRQGGPVGLDGMYHMQFSCAAVDYTQGYRRDVESETHDYITTDLLCYRAQEPHDLVALQNTQWNPWVDWAEKRYGIQLVLVAGIMPAPQSGETLETIAEHLAALDDFALIAVWLLAKHTGSLLLALYASRRRDTETAAVVALAATILFFPFFHPHYLVQLLIPAAFLAGRGQWWGLALPLLGWLPGQLMAPAALLGAALPLLPPRFLALRPVGERLGGAVEFETGPARP
jgi:chaperone required for assembly of F1-ATPase